MAMELVMVVWCLWVLWVFLMLWLWSQAAGILVRCARAAPYPAGVPTRAVSLAMEPMIGLWCLWVLWVFLMLWL